MTHETLDELHQKFSKAISVQRQINDLNKIITRRNDVKLWGVCIYYDEECEDSLYVDMPLEDLQRFIEEIVITRIKVLGQEFAAL